jgi:cobyrinic acid a,c-diamide synthase
MRSAHVPRLVIAATHSHAGKTTVTLALLAALARRGLRVAPFKVGPDYIDPQLHRRAVGRASYNLDTYLVPAERVRHTFQRLAQPADIAIIEGVMGLFDGSAPTSRVGSTAEVAALLQAPVVLVIDAAGMAASVGALVRGFRTYDPAVQIAGVILNRLGGEGHYGYLLPALAEEGVEVLGYLPHTPELHIPERHLGLLPAAEEDRVTPLLERLIALTQRHVDVDGIIRLAGAAPALAAGTALPEQTSPRRIRLAWAQDEAFHFTYQENLDLLYAAGADIVPFRPLHDVALPDHIDAIWIGGGLCRVRWLHVPVRLARRSAGAASCAGWFDSGWHPDDGPVTTVRLCRGDFSAGHPVWSGRHQRTRAPLPLLRL